MIIQQLSAPFETKDLGIEGKFLGMEIDYRDNGCIKIDRNEYIQQLESHGMLDCNPITTPFDRFVKVTATTETIPSLIGKNRPV